MYCTCVDTSRMLHILYWASRRLSHRFHLPVKLGMAVLASNAAMANSVPILCCICRTVPTRVAAHKQLARIKMKPSSTAFLRNPSHRRTQDPHVRWTEAIFQQTRRPRQQVDTGQPESNVDRWACKEKKKLNSYSTLIQYTPDDSWQLQLVQYFTATCQS